MKKGIKKKERSNRQEGNNSFKVFAFIFNLLVYYLLCSRYIGLEYKN